MISMYVDGEKIGPAPDLESMLEQYTSKGKLIELRDDKGHSLGSIRPDVPPIPWHPEITRADIDRVVAERGGKSLAEFWKDMGVECPIK